MFELSEKKHSYEPDSPESSSASERLLSSDPDVGHSSHRASETTLLRQSAPAVKIHPCIICCTIFSLIAFILLTLLGTYAAADKEGRYFILDPGETVDERLVKAGHVFGAAACYMLLTIGCGGWWWKKKKDAKIL